MRSKIKIINRIKELKKDEKFKLGDDVRGFKIKGNLGEGRYGITYIAYKSDFDFVTVKQLKKGITELCKDKVRYEAEILKDLNTVESSYFPKFIVEPSPTYYRPRTIVEVGDSYFVDKFGMTSRYPYCLERVQFAPIHSL